MIYKNYINPGIVGAASWYENGILAALIHNITFKLLLVRHEFNVFDPNLMNHYAFLKLIDKLLSYVLKNVDNHVKWEKVENK